MRTLRFACASAVVVAVAVSAATPASAQNPAPDSYINIGTYTIGIPVGDTHRFINAPVGWFGVAWEGQWPFRSHLAKGLSFSLQDFSDSKAGTTTFPSGAITGHQNSELLMMALMGTVRWYPGIRWGHGLYLGMGAGGEFDQQYYTVGFSRQMVRSGVHLLIAPDIGVITRVMGDIDMVINARFMVPSSAGSYLGGGPRSFQFVALSVGIAER